MVDLNRNQWSEWSGIRSKLSSNPYDPDSISNPYGRYGNPHSYESINNPFGAGNPYLYDSPKNQYGSGWVIVGE